MLKLIGYIVFGVSILIWFSIPVVPFLGFSVGVAAGITTGLIIAGEITFYLSIFLIGKEFLVKIKNKFKQWKVKPTPVSEESEPEE
ncbi:MAG: transporter suffix domain-containing protein [Bacteroidota bacterium]|nr:transporter suffix domain-containing protein [Bacteroidota bacterium]